MFQDDFVSVVSDHTFTTYVKEANKDFRAVWAALSARQEAIF